MRVTSEERMRVTSEERIRVTSDEMTKETVLTLNRVIQELHNNSIKSSRTDSGLNV